MAPGVLELSLRRVLVTGRLRKRRAVDLVIAAQRFRDHGQLAEVTRFAGELEELQRYCERGEFGCFVRTVPTRDGDVRVTLVERRWDGAQVRTEIHADRSFDAAEEDAVARSAAFAAELRVWAEERNDAMEAALRDAADDRELERVQLEERQRGARELAQILDRL